MSSERLVKEIKFWMRSPKSFCIERSQNIYLNVYEAIKHKEFAEIFSIIKNPRVALSLEHFFTFASIKIQRDLLDEKVTTFAGLYSNQNYIVLPSDHIFSKFLDGSKYLCFRCCEFKFIRALYQKLKPYNFIDCKSDWSDPHHLTFGSYKCDSIEALWTDFFALPLEHGKLLLVPPSFREREDAPSKLLEHLRILFPGALVEPFTLEEFCKCVGKVVYASCSLHRKDTDLEVAEMTLSLPTLCAFYESNLLCRCNLEAGAVKAFLLNYWKFGIWSPLGDNVRKLFPLEFNTNLGSALPSLDFLRAFINLL